MKVIFAAALQGTKKRNAGVLAGAALAALLTSSAAFAQCAAPVQTGIIIGNAADFSIPAAAASANIASAIGNVNTAFLTQQGSAFVSAPGNPSPDQPGGGVWVRGIGGEVTTKSSSDSAATTRTVAGGVVVNTIATACNTAQRDSFAGAQVGADIARLNWGGWNVHLGTTAGFLGSKSSDNFGFNNKIEVPFFGTYLVATHGRFFADVMVRREFYNISLSNPGFTYFGQPVGARGVSISASAGYNFDLGNNWFIEPSAGFIYSKTVVDSFTNPGTVALPVSGTVALDDVSSQIGRASLRVGRTIATPNIIWQPFGSASVFREFAGNVVTNYATGANTVALGAVPVTVNQRTTTSRVGTYGQYSLGLAGQVVNTGWLGFVRVDYRHGDNIDGWTGNAGLRYQFTPELLAAVMPTKFKAPPRAVIGPTSWTGFYLGGFAGAAAGRTDIGFVGDGNSRPWVAGGIGGITAGYNHHLPNNWVLGVEGDIGAANIKGGRTAGAANGLPVGGIGAQGFSPNFLTVQDKTNWQGTVTGRVGYSLSRTLIYGKGGVAFEDSTVSVGCIFGPTGVTPGGVNCVNQAGVVTGGFTTPNRTRVGWTIGYGTEFDLGRNWSAKGEYSYLAFGRRTALASDGSTLLTDRADISQVKIGVNYRFGAPAAVVAKY